ncbi:MAG TPA: hypothetical protein VFK65_24730, partial [Candidatus Binatia bacterium]|nr:hypothetical protein [Candidatus Binatia bacterium]
VPKTREIEARYFNPKPINIAKAEATREGSTLKVFVDLRAPRYPGGTYRLIDNLQQVKLNGISFQGDEQ